MEFDKPEYVECMSDCFRYRSNIGGITFLQPCKKVTKEDGIGEALTAKPIEAALESSIFPRLRAALPYVPLPALVGSPAVVERI